MALDPAPTTDTRPTNRPRSIVHLPSHRSEYFSSRQSPLLPPPTRRNDLPYSSQSGPSERHSSPVKDSVDIETGVEPVAGPSTSRTLIPTTAPMQSSTGWSDDEDDFDGIEDAVATQPVLEAESSRGKQQGAITLEDLFDDEPEEALGDVYKGAGHTSSGSGIRSSAETRTRVEDLVDLVDLSQSPSPGSDSRSRSHLRGSSPGLSGRGNHIHSDTPPSPLPKTPPTDDAIIPWSPSPVTQRTKRRTANDYGRPLSAAEGIVGVKRSSVAQPQSTKKGKEKFIPPVEEVEEEEEYEYENFDFPFPDDLDFEMMDAHPTTNTSTLSRPSSSTSYPTPVAADPGRSFRPSSINHTTSNQIPTFNHYIAPNTSATATHSSPPRHVTSDQSHIASMLDEMEDPDRLLLITDLTPAEQDFYRNHWRRGADKESKKKTTTTKGGNGDEDEEEDYEDGGFSGPQPTEKKKTFKRGGGFKRGGFRGRGRGKARGRSRK